jgi:hypothetical protein
MHITELHENIGHTWYRSKFRMLQDQSRHRATLSITCVHARRNLNRPFYPLSTHAASTAPIHCRHTQRRGKDAGQYISLTVRIVSKSRLISQANHAPPLALRSLPIPFSHPVIQRFFTIMLLNAMFQHRFSPHTFCLITLSLPCSRLHNSPVSFIPRHPQSRTQQSRFCP